MILIKTIKQKIVDEVSIISSEIVSPRENALGVFFEVVVEFVVQLDINFL
jgi:hypothetical protein